MRSSRAARMSFTQLQLDEEDSYVMVLSFHGINKQEHIDFIFRDEAIWKC